DEAGVIVLDASVGKEILRRPFKIDANITTLHPDSIGCMIYGAEKLLYVNSTNGKFYERVFDHSDLRAQNLVNVNGKYSMWLSMRNRMVVINTETPALLWESANGDGQFMGFAHQLYPALGGSTKGVLNILTMYVEPRSEGDNPGTYLFAQSINATTGRVLYRTVVAIASDVISTNKVDDIGIDYNVFEHKDRTCVTVTSPSALINPATRTEPGEGIVVIDQQTGVASFAKYFAVASGMEEEFDAPPIAFADDVVYMAGDNRLIAVDLLTGKQKWSVEKELGGQIFDLSIIDNILYAKLGRQKNTVSNNAKLSITEDWTSMPYRFVAIDPLTGKVLWRAQVETDPDLATDDSFEHFFDERRNQLYFSDLQNVYALSMGRNGGSYAWTTSLTETGLGDIDLGQAYGYNAERNSIVQPVKLSWLNKTLIMYGQESIAALNQENGKPLWTHQWRYGSDVVALLPRLIDNNLLYAVRGNIVYLNLSTGATLWTSPITVKAEVITTIGDSVLIVRDGNLLTGYQLKGL
ncbi:MAG: PQQ-binding-like beta-propeller repeat protein, partial [Candidatus Kapabacteria bacterium]|nr:PQQ-binding-like beta-propeller repeat protein [Candidatus Kapabacteria bacterium]